MFTRRAACIAVALILGAVAAPAAHAALRVVATGDSLTLGYAPWRLDAAFDQYGCDAVVSTVATSGCGSDRYVGEAFDAEAKAFRSYAADVVASDPDVIIFMLGTNDAFRLDPEAFLDYAHRINGVFETFASAVNTRGRHPTVIVSTCLPVLGDDPASRAYVANQRIDTLYNPWLANRAAKYGFVLHDANAEIRTIVTWRDFYSDDGIHLWAYGGAGYTLLAHRFSAATVDALAISAVPEPATLCLLGLGAVMFLRRR